MVVMGEVKQGYPEHKWVVVGHLGEAADECAKKYPELAAEIRQHRLAYMQDVNHDIPVMELIAKASGMSESLLSESPKEIMQSVRVVAQNSHQPAAWRHFVETVMTDGYVPQLIDNNTGKKYRILGVGHGVGREPYGLLVIPVDATLVTEQFTITPVALKSGDYSPTVDLKLSQQQREKNKRMVKLKRGLAST